MLLGLPLDGVIPILNQTINNAECLVLQTLSLKNYYTFNCSNTYNQTLVLSYVECIFNLILMNTTLQVSGAELCPGVDLNPVSAALANCEWCYPKYGCFQVGGPYISLAHSISLPPEPEPCLGLKLQLYTQNNKQTPYNFAADDDKLKVQSSPFNSTWPSIFIIGGYQNGDFSPYYKMYLEGFLNCKSYNVFIVNWAMASGSTYEIALANARLVGAMLAKFITLLKDKLNYPPSNCHLIGHSSGGIVASETGKRLVVDQLGRITGLDSAGLLYFNHADPAVRLDPTDAIFVDLIHSNAGETGTIDKAGHLDFWPNGGVIEPGCLNPISQIANATFFDIILLACSHLKSIYYYYYSLPCAPGNCNFTAHMCSDYLNYLTSCKNDSCSAFDGSKCAKMGFNSIDYKLANYPLPANQSFYLQTNAVAPYCED